MVKSASTIAMYGHKSVQFKIHFIKKYIYVADLLLEEPNENHFNSQCHCKINFLYYIK